MNQSASIPATLTAKRSESRQADRPIVLGVFLAVLVALACAVLVLDTPMTTQQRIALFLETGTFP